MSLEDWTMPDWFNRAIGSSSFVDWNILLIRLIGALLLGLLITVIYHAARPAGAVGTFPTTLVLLCILIAMVTQVIGENTARAFSLVGVLSIVRFRTVVRDTKDTAFVVFAVVIGMAVGAGQTSVAICGLTIVGLAAILMRDKDRNLLPIDRESILTVRFTWSPELEKLVTDSLSKYASEIEPTTVVTVRQGAAFELSYRLQLRPDAKPAEMVAELNRIEGIMSVELQAQRGNGS
jgi:uncharacterized membrane protein YhiD involved in acid resistance